MKEEAEPKAGAGAKLSMNRMGAAEPDLDLDEQTDERLVEILVAGDKSAFDVLVRRHKARLYNYLLRLLRDPGDAEEVTQETLIRAYVHADKYRNIAKFSTWLYTIATNLVRNRIRKAKSSPRLLSLSFDKSDEENSERSPIDLPDTADLPDRALEKSELHDRVAQGIERIPAKYREAFVLREVNHCTYEEIAAITGLKLGTVRSRINRGRSRFREVMEPLLHKALKAT